MLNLDNGNGTCTKEEIVSLDLSVRTKLSICDGVTTYKMPRLIAMATPNFSRFFICSFQRIAQGNSARMKSVAAEYAVGKESVRNEHDQRT